MPPDSPIIRATPGTQPEDVTDAARELTKALSATPNFRRLDRNAQTRAIRSRLSQMAPNFTKHSAGFQQLAVNRVLESAAPPLDTGEIAQVSLEDKAAIPFGMAGATVGAAAGSAGGPVGTAIGGAVGGALGTAAGIAFPEATRQFLAPNLPQRFNTTQLIERMATEGGIAGLFHGAGEGLSAIASRALGALRRRTVLGGADETAEVASARRAISEKGGSLTPSQLRSEEDLPALTSFIENVSRFALFARGSFTKLDARNRQAVIDMADDTVRELSSALSPSQFAKLTVDATAQARQLSSPVARALWSDVDRLAGGVTPNITNAADHVAKLQATPAGKTLFDGLTLVDDAGAPLTIQRIMAAPTFGTVSQARSQLLKFRNATERSTDGTVQAARRLAGDLQGRLLKSLDDALSSVGPHATNAYQRARDFTRETTGVFDDRATLELIRKARNNPEAFTEQLFKAGPKAAESLRTLKRLEHVAFRRVADARNLDTPNLFEQAQSTIAKEILKRSQVRSTLTGTTEHIDGKTLLNVFTGKGSLNEDFVKEAFSPGIQQALPRLANAIDIAAKRPGGPGRMFIQFAQASQLVGGAVAAGSALGLGTDTGLGQASLGFATTILLGPKFAAKMFTNKKTMQNVIDGIIGGPKSAAFRRLTTQIGVTEREDLGAVIDRLGPFGALGIGPGTSPTATRLSQATQPPTQHGPTTIGAPRPPLR